jgi:hypothetical protein
MILRDLLRDLETIVLHDPKTLDARVTVDTEAMCDKYHLYEVRGVYPPDKKAACDSVVIALDI